MTRAVIFKTPTKLDLRSITTFGLNSKPNTNNPIGYFGTGLKMAMAVLVREDIAFNIWINGKKWVAEAKESDFRGKKVKEIQLVTFNKIGFKRVLKLPFTTELAKNWTFWQVFRELHSNTIDEGGSTFLQTDWDEFGEKGSTKIEIADERMVQEYLDRDKTFLPEGLTKRDDTESLQVFERPCQHIYYRGIRVFDLPEKERSELTYNILQQIELTEDRTIKDPWTAKYIISNYISKTTNKDVARRFVSAPQRSYEASIPPSFLSSPSEVFLDEAKQVPEPNYYIKDFVKENTPKPPKTTSYGNWKSELATFIAVNDFENILDVIKVCKVEILEHLKGQDIQKKALDVAVKIIMANEPGDSRAVSDIAVALAGVSTGIINQETIDLIEKELANGQTTTETDETKREDSPFQGRGSLYPELQGIDLEDEIPF